MKKFVYHFLFFFVAVLGISSCESEKPKLTGSSPIKYYFAEYFLPKRLVVSSESRNGVNTLFFIEDSKISLKNNPTEFLHLAKEYGETGETEFWKSGPGLLKPYGLAQMKAFLLKEGQKIDISDSVNIVFEDVSEIIFSKYKNMDAKKAEWKKLSELTSHDLKWMQYTFSISHSLKEEGEYYLVVTLTNGEELSVKLKF